MQDEADLLTEFRAAIRELVDDARKQDQHISEVLQDVVNPRVAKLQRRFTQISEMSSLKTGGAIVATATLALTSVVSGGLVAGAAALAGGSGLLLVARELAGRRGELNALKDDPTAYLLWKLKGQRA